MVPTRFPIVAVTGPLFLGPESVAWTITFFVPKITPGGIASCGSFGGVGHPNSRAGMPPLISLWGQSLSGSAPSPSSLMSSGPRE